MFFPSEWNTFMMVDMFRALFDQDFRGDEIDRQQDAIEYIYIYI